MSGLWWGSLRPWTLSPRHKTQTQTLAAEEPDSTAAQEPIPQLQPLELRNPPYDFESTFRVAMQARAEALFTLESASIFRARTQIAQLALKSRLPTSFAFREYVEAGGLMSYGTNFNDIVAARRRLCRQDPARSQARRPPHRTNHQVRSSHQSQTANRPWRKSHAMHVAMKRLTRTAGRAGAGTVRHG